MLTTILVMTALVVPLSGTATAVTSDNSYAISTFADVTTEGTEEEVATVVEIVDAGGTGIDCSVTPETGDCEIDFEIESGAAVTILQDATAVYATPATHRTSDDGNTPQTPDATCLIDQDDSFCDIIYTSATAGSNTIRAWVDNDADNSTFDADQTEGRYAGVTDEEPSTPAPGSRTERDDTDVIQANWFASLVANFDLDCTPESQTLPSSGAGSGASITCKAFNDNGAGGGTADNNIQDGTEAGIAGVLIDGENLNGDNDPDNGDATPADYNNLCTTGADGTCSGTVPASESQAGGAAVCFWADADNDSESDGGDPYDGSDCGVEAVGTNDSDETDLVEIEWVAPGTATTIVCSPRSAQKLIGASHTVDCHVEDPFGNPSVGALVDFDVFGKNGAAGADDSATDTNGDVSFTYTDNGVAPSPEGEEDEIEAALDNGNGDDTVFAYWFTAIPTVADVVIDAENLGPLCEDTDAATDDEFVPTEVGGSWFMCVSALDSLGGGIPGASVTVTTTGVGFLTSNENGDTSFDDGETLVTSVELTTNADGDVFFVTYSEESGEQTLTATSGAASDSNSRDWFSSLARNITCDPAGSSPTGTTQIVNCMVTDRYANPVDSFGYSPLVEFSESGAGRIDSADGTPDATGEVEVVTSTTSGEEGVQVISAEITDDGDGGQQECLALANTGSNGGGVEAGTPAGNCEATAETTWTDEPAGLDHARTLTLDRVKHVKDGGKRKLFLKGLLTVDDGFAACSEAQEVKLQRKVAGSWFTQKTDTTGTGGNAKFLVRDRNGKYRLRANESTDGTDTCGRATSNVKRHRHKKGGGGGAKFYR